MDKINQSLTYQKPTLADFFRGKKVLVTGHTGFKGSWLTTWLLQLGAKVTGFSNGVPHQPSLFEMLRCDSDCETVHGDIRNFQQVCDVVSKGQFDIIFHMAAQSLVRYSYANPLETTMVNTMGTAHILEAVRIAASPCNVIVITSDKCYANDEELWGFRETDAMGGRDPYSMSKGAAELVVSSWRASYFSKTDSKVKVASARAGNVIGGGDWSQDRIIPDCIRSLINNKPISVRNPSATRPWQHVLEPLGAYLLLAASLDSDLFPPVDEGWNFGPSYKDTKAVRDLVELLIHHWGSGTWKDESNADSVHEAKTLGLNCEKAYSILNWSPIWNFERAVQETTDWYKLAKGNNPTVLRDVTLSQIETYQANHPMFSELI